MTPTLPNADELEVVAYCHECRNKNGQLWDWTVSQDAEMEFSTEHAPGSGEDYVSIAKPLVTLSSAQAQIEEAKRRNAELDRELSGVRRSYFEERAQIDRLTRERDEGLERVATLNERALDDVSNLTMRAEAAEAEVKRIREALTSAGQQAENAAWNIGKPGHKFTPADIQQGFFNIMEFCRSALSGGTSNG